MPAGRYTPLGMELLEGRHKLGPVVRQVAELRNSGDGGWTESTRLLRALYRVDEVQQRRFISSGPSNHAAQQSHTRGRLAWLVVT